MKKFFYLAFVLGLTIFFVACTNRPFGGETLPGEDITVRMARATWDTGWFQAEVFKLLLEELGYTVKSTEALNNVAFYFFSAQGDVDFWANGWFPLHNRYLEYKDVAGKVRPVGFQVKTGALQGYMVDKATAEALGITNLADLQDENIAAVFDKDGDGKADLIGCNAGWGCERVIEHHLEAYDLQDTVFHMQGEYSTLMAETVTRYASGEPVLFYTWTPNWTVSEFVIDKDVMWLSVPFSSLPDEPTANTAATNIFGCLETPCDLGFGANDIRIVANVEFLAANPAAATLFEQVEIPLSDISAQNVRMAAGENSDKRIRDHAATWVETNRIQVDQWLAAARAAAK